MSSSSRLLAEDASSVRRHAAVMASCTPAVMNVQSRSDSRTDSGGERVTTMKAGPRSPAAMHRHYAEQTDLDAAGAAARDRVAGTCRARAMPPSTRSLSTTRKSAPMWPRWWSRCATTRRGRLGPKPPSFPEVARSVWRSGRSRRCAGGVVARDRVRLARFALTYPRSRPPRV